MLGYSGANMALPLKKVQLAEPLTYTKSGGGVNPPSSVAIRRANSMVV